MRISVVYNPTAGNGQDGADVERLLAEAGHEVQLASSKGRWRKLLQDPGDLVVAAGGDGTVRKVALAAEEAGVPFAILPFGTANNIAKTLGLSGATSELVASLEAAAADPQPFDLGVAAGPWGEARFVEAFGGGPFADLMAAGDEIGHPTALMGRETDRALHVLGELLERATPEVWGVMADGSDRSDQYLGVELLNVAFAGPNVPLAPTASATDGRLDLVLITEDDRSPLLGYVRDRLTMASGTLPALARLSVSEVEIHPPPGVRLRLDDKGWPDGEPLDEGARVRARVLAGAGRIALRG